MGEYLGGNAGLQDIAHSIDAMISSAMVLIEPPDIVARAFEYVDALPIDSEDHMIYDKIETTYSPAFHTAQPQTHKPCAMIVCVPSEQGAEGGEELFLNYDV